MYCIQIHDDVLKDLLVKVIFLCNRICRYKLEASFNWAASKSVTLLESNTLSHVFNLLNVYVLTLHMKILLGIDHLGGSLIISYTHGFLLFTASVSFLFKIFMNFNAENLHLYN